MKSDDTETLREIVESLEELNVQVEVDDLGREHPVYSADGTFRGYGGQCTATLRLRW